MRQSLLNASICGLGFALFSAATSARVLTIRIPPIRNRNKEKLRFQKDGSEVEKEAKAQST